MPSANRSGRETAPHLPISACRRRPVGRSRYLVSFRRRFKRLLPLARWIRVRIFTGLVRRELILAGVARRTGRLSDFRSPGIRRPRIPDNVHLRRGALKSRSNWLLAAGAIIILAGGILFALLRNNFRYGHHFSATDATVLQIAVSPLLALLGWTSRKVSLGSGRSTPKQLKRAQQTLAARGRDWWRAIPEPAWPGQILRAGSRPLNVTWGRARLAEQDGSDSSVCGSISDTASLAAWFRTAAPCRLVIRGEAGSGKSVLARRLMDDLLGNLRPGERVPVFLPLWSWDPDQEGLFDWMKRRIDQEYPELRDSRYGPNSVAGLVDKGLVLPVLDGLDTLPERWRKAVFSDAEFLSEDRLILTCRTTEGLGLGNGFAVIDPYPVAREEATSFLRSVTPDRPGLWDKVGAHVCNRQPCGLDEALARPRFVYLAGMIYGTRKDHGEAAATISNDPAELTDHDLYPSADVLENLLLQKLIPVLMPIGGDWAQGFLGGGERAELWLRNLALLDLLDPADKKERANGQDPFAGGSATSRITWWNLHRGIPWLNRSQALLRGLASGIITFCIIALIFHHYPAIFALLTAGAYAISIAIASAFLGREGRAEVRISSPRVPRLGTLSWQLRSALTQNWRITITAVSIFLCFGFMTGLRVRWETGTISGVRVGYYDGLVTALIVVLTFFIAGVPSSPRTVHAVDFGSTKQAEIRGFGRTIILGVAFGIIWGISSYARKSNPQLLPSLPSAVLSGVITGLDFALGAWLFRFAQVRVKARQMPDPLASARADLTAALLTPLILGATFALAFGATALLHPIASSKLPDIAAWFVIGTALGSLGSEWPLYMTATTWLGMTRPGQLPLRPMRFLECCRKCGLLRTVGQEYQIYDDALLRHLRDPLRAQASPAAQGN